MTADEGIMPEAGSERVQAGARIAYIIRDVAKLATADLANLSHAIAEMVERRGAPKHPSLRQIKEAVALASGVSVEELSSERRDYDVNRSRKVAMALCKHLTQAGYPRIGKTFERDHAAALRACRQLEPLIADAAKIVPPHATVADWAAVMLARYGAVMEPRG